MTDKDVAEKLRVTEDQAKKVRDLIHGKADPLEYASVQKWVNQCYNMPSKVELKLCAINEIIEGFGIEYIEHVDDTFRDTLGVSYVNLGDSYTTTVCYDHDLEKFVYACWADFVEKYPDNYV